MPAEHDRLERNGEIGLDSQAVERGHSSVQPGYLSAAQIDRPPWERQRSGLELVAETLTGQLPGPTQEAPAFAAGPKECSRSSSGKPIANVALLWHGHGMKRVRVSTTVDEGLLEEARRLRSDVKDAVLIDEALAALLAQHRSVEIDAAYSAYDVHPLDELDEWGDLASFREAAGSS